MYNLWRRLRYEPEKLSNAWKYSCNAASVATAGSLYQSYTCIKRLDLFKTDVILDEITDLHW